MNFSAPRPSERNGRGFGTLASTYARAGERARALELLAETMDRSKRTLDLRFCDGRGTRRCDLFNRLGREGHIREDFRDVGIVVAVAIPCPAGTGIEQFAVRADLFKTGTINAPDVPVARRNGARGVDEGEAAPRHSNFCGPAAVNVVPLVQRAIYVDGVTKAWAIPI